MSKENRKVFDLCVDDKSLIVLIILAILGPIIGQWVNWLSGFQSLLLGSFLLVALYFIAKRQKPQENQNTQATTAQETPANSDEYVSNVKQDAPQPQAALLQNANDMYSLEGFPYSIGKGFELDLRYQKAKTNKKKR